MAADELNPSFDSSIEPAVWRYVCTNGAEHGMSDREGVKPLDPAKEQAEIASVKKMTRDDRMLVAAHWEHKVAVRSQQLGHDPRTPADRAHHAAMEEQAMAIVRAIDARRVPRPNTWRSRVGRASRRGTRRATAVRAGSRGSPPRPDDPEPHQVARGAA
jgi:hypothetical protein